MSLLEKLYDENTWKQFRQYKSEHSFMSPREFDRLDEYIRNHEYLPVAETLAFSVPEKKMINKSGSSRKRTVYIFPEKENWILKMLTWLLYRYDHCFHPSCFSFRRNYTAQKAIRSLMNLAGLQDKYVLKADIHDYFNSIPSDLLVGELGKVITDDDELLTFLKNFFTLDQALWEGKIIRENRGAMAGMPVSAFIANIYLRNLDEVLSSGSYAYYRYSDDILLLADSRQQRDECFNLLKEHLRSKGLELNPDKLALLEPGEPWDFLGFRYDNGQIDLAEATIRKMKARIRRKAMALERWRKRRNADYERTARALIRRFNRKFYDFDDEYEFTWSRWFFPILTTDRGLKEIDGYLLDYIRYLYSGRHYKGNYIVKYDDIKSMGYHSLVHEYHRFRKDKQFASGHLEVLE